MKDERFDILLYIIAQTFEERESLHPSFRFHPSYYENDLIKFELR